MNDIIVVNDLGPPAANPEELVFRRLTVFMDANTETARQRIWEIAEFVATGMRFDDQA